MHNPTDRIVHTKAFVIPVVELWVKREIDQWVHREGSIRRPIPHERPLCYATTNLKHTRTRARNGVSGFPLLLLPVSIKSVGLPLRQNVCLLRESSN